MQAQISERDRVRAARDRRAARAASRSRRACSRSASCWPIPSWRRPDARDAAAALVSRGRAGPRRSRPGCGSAVPSLARMFETWFFAVRGLMPSSRRSRRSPSRARSGAAPRARARTVRRAPSPAGSSSAPSRRTRPRTTSAARGESQATPLAAARTATTTPSIGVSLARKPHAPASTTAATSASSETTVSATTRDRRVPLEDLAGGLGPLEIGHAHVHQHDVRLQLVRQPDAHAAAGRLRHHLDAGCASSRDASPARNRSWSSTTSTRIDPSCHALRSFQCHVVAAPWIAVRPPHELGAAPMPNTHYTLAADVHRLERVHGQRRPIPPWIGQLP